MAQTIEDIVIPMEDKFPLVMMQRDIYSKQSIIYQHQQELDAMCLVFQKKLNELTIKLEVDTEKYSFDLEKLKYVPKE